MREIKSWSSNYVNFTFFNDTGREVHIHPATELGTLIKNLNPIKPLEERVIVLPETKNIHFKLWESEEGLTMFIKL